MPVPCTMNGPRITSMDSAHGYGLVMQRGADDGSTGLDSQLWHACAGGMVQMPSVNARVYYFPQGQAEHSATNVEFPASLRAKPAILCRVLNVKFMADTETDEVYARIRLVPIKPNEVAMEDCSEDNGNAAANEKPVSFAKTLTQSDANNGGGFSVPRYCAETIFPRLDYSSDPPVQTVLAKDVHGEVWKFRHIYRGTPRRHLLTTGWSTFVNQKKLVAGDSIVFLRSLNGELCVGIRRSTRSTGGGDSSAWHLAGQQQQQGSCMSPYRSSSRWEVKGGDNFSAAFFGGGDKASANGNSNGFARNKGKVSAKSVIESATLAATGQPFEVVYYPRASTPEFCVKANAVDSALGMKWNAGMRFKMAFETEDSSRISWFMGTISLVQCADPIHWPTSPWRLLQVTWDEPDLLQNVKRVSPWLVEVVSNVPPIQLLSPFTLPKKKLRVSQHPEFQFEGHGIMGGLQMATLTNNVLGQINPWHGLSENVPAGMQGARHGHIYGVSLSDFHPNKLQSGLSLDSFHQLEQGALSSTPVSTDLNIGCFSQLERSSVQDNLSCVLTMGNSSQSEQKATKGRSTSSTTKSAPFLLFGKPIHTEQSPKSEQQQQSGVSSSDGPGFHVVNDSGSPGLTSNSSTDGNPEVVDRLQRAMTSRSDTSKLSENYGLRLYCGETLDSTVNNGGGNLAWFKDRQVSLPTLENGSGGKTSEDGVIHCKAFLESEDVGRTLDLSLFSGYEELHNKLAKMFGIEDSDLSNRVLYKDTAGIGRHTGDQPYGDFMKTVRRLTILSDSSSDNMSR